MSANMQGLDPTAAILLQNSLKQTEEDLREGRLAADVAVDSLAEMDAFYFSARQADGNRVTGLLVRTRVPPYALFVLGPLTPVSGETARILAERLPAPPTPSPAQVGPLAPKQQYESRAMQRAREAGEAARKHNEGAGSPAGFPQKDPVAEARARAKAHAVARPLRTPPGALSPQDLGAPKDDDIPPPIKPRRGGGERIPQG